MFLGDQGPSATGQRPVRPEQLAGLTVYEVQLTAGRAVYPFMLIFR